LRASQGSVVKEGKILVLRTRVKLVGPAEDKDSTSSVFVHLFEKGRCVNPREVIFAAGTLVRTEVLAKRVRTVLRSFVFADRATAAINAKLLQILAVPILAFTVVYVSASNQDTGVVVATPDTVDTVRNQLLVSTNYLI
jgi:hypothetical protein